MITNKQAGFSHLIIITLTLAVAVIGLLGYVFWQNFLQPKNNSNPVANSNSTTKTAATDNTKYFSITELGVKGVYNGKYNLSYKVTDNYVSLTTSDSPSECQGRILDTIRRYSKDDTITNDGHIALETPISPAQAYKDWPRSGIVKIGDYYYVLNQGVTDDCPGTIGEVSVESVVLSDIKDFFMSLQAI